MMKIFTSLSAFFLPIVLTACSTVSTHEAKSDLEKAITDFKRLNNHKAFAISINNSGHWTYGYGEGYPTPNQAERVALQFCESHRENAQASGYSVDKACSIHMVGNVVQTDSGTTAADIVRTRDADAPPLESE